LVRHWLVGAREDPVRGKIGNGAGKLGDRSRSRARACRHTVAL